MPVIYVSLSAHRAEESTLLHQSKLSPLYIASRKLFPSVHLFSLSDSPYRKLVHRHAHSIPRCTWYQRIYRHFGALFLLTWNAILHVAIFSIHSCISKVCKYLENFNAQNLPIQKNSEYSWQIFVMSKLRSNNFMI